MDDDTPSSQRDSPPRRNRIDFSAIEAGEEEEEEERIFPRRYVGGSAIYLYLVAF